jgi:hypothetical protein
LLIFAALFSAPVDAAGVDWGQVVVTSVNNLVGLSGGAFVHNGLVMVAVAGFCKVMYSIINTSWQMIDSFDSFRVHFNSKEIGLVLFQMWLLTQVLNHWMVPFSGTGLSVHHIPMYITDGLVALLNQGQMNAFVGYLSTISQNMQHPNPLDLLGVATYLFILVNMGMLSAVTFVLTSFGYIGEAILIVVTPLFVWCALTKTFFSWIFNCVQALCAFAAYRVLSNVILYILSEVLVNFFVHGIGNNYTIANWIAMLPVVIMLTGLFVFALFLIPLLAASLFNGAGAIGQTVISAIGSAAKEAVAA